MTRHYAANSVAIVASADFFLADVKRKMKNYSHEEILNADEVDLEFELYSTSTLSHEAENVTLARVKSKNVTAHPYTIQPTISSCWTTCRSHLSLFEGAKGRDG